MWLLPLLLSGRLLAAPSRTSTPAQTTIPVQTILELWPGKVPGEREAKHPPQPVRPPKKVPLITDVTDPLVTVFEPSGPNRHTGIIICPGGGNKYLSIDSEGTAVARRFTHMGFTAFVLQYRVPDKRDGALQDIQRAIRVIRSQATRWQLDSGKLGVMGFSAGGNLAARASTEFRLHTYPAIDRADSLSCRPDFAVLCYPGSMATGPEHKLIPELTVDSLTSPAFIVVANDDPIGVPLSYAYALHDAKVPMEMHVFPTGGHGFGLHPRNGADFDWPPMAEQWITAEERAAGFNAIWKHADRQYHYLMTRVPEGVMPRSFGNDSLRTCTSENWVAGFYPGSLLYLYEGTGDKSLYTEALHKITLMDRQQFNTGTHDLGFMLFCSYGNLYKLDPDPKYKEILLNAARSLSSRFNPRVGCIRSWGKSDDTSSFRVIIDNMINLELLLWATETTGDSSFYRIAVTHANTTMRNHFRPNYSSYHVVVYNPQTGAVMKKQTAQGAGDGSAWARGQSWGLYGFTTMYRYTHDTRYLEQAQHIAAFILDNPNLPSDKIPYWDYDAPGIPAAPRDASAGAILASGLIELARYSDKSLAKRYLQTADTILHSLSSPAYTSPMGQNGGFLLEHSVANMNKNTEVNSPLPYADYYYLEALLRMQNKLK